MTSETEGSQRRNRRRNIIVAVVASVLVLGVAVALALNATTATPSGASPSSTSPSSPAPTATPTVPAELPQLPPVAPDQPAPTEDGIGVKIVTAESVQGEAELPGEVSGPAVRYTVEISNTSAEPLDLAFVSVNAYIGPSLDPALNLIKPGGLPFSGVVEPGASATGVYVFRVPADQRGDVTVTVDYRAGTPAAVFRGAAPAA